MNAVFPGLSVLSGSTLASLHYSTLGLSAQERLALTAPEKRDKQFTGERGGKGEGKGERGEGGRRGRRMKEESAGPRGSKNTQTHRQASHGWCLSELVCMGEGLTVA